MWLVRNGVPFDVAFRTAPGEFRMGDATRRALCVICGEFEGRRFNWSSMKFEDPK